MTRSFYLASMVVFMGYGIVAQRLDWFPVPQLSFVVGQAKLALGMVGEIGPGGQWYYLDDDGRQLTTAPLADQVQPGLTLITGIAADKLLQIKVIDKLGEVIHHWDLDWFRIWPEATHIPEDKRPKGKPGTHIHGSRLMDNGDIVFNYENLGLVRLDACGNTVFKLAYPTHHAINMDDQGHFWLPGQINYRQPKPGYPSHIAPFKDDTVVEVSAEGELLQQISIMDLLRDNGYEGLLFMSTLSSRKPTVTGDLFHLNDVEVFPSSMAEGVFKQGDILVSLRNINTVLVFEPKSRKIRFLSSGKFVRQHDPDFVDGNTLSVFDNNNHMPAANNPSSKIVLVSALDGSVTPYFTGSPAQPFFSNIMGKHQWLANGNLLILESMNGRVFEINRDKSLVWSFNNLIEATGKVSIMEGAERLAPQFDRAFFQSRVAQCHNQTQS